MTDAHRVDDEPDSAVAVAAPPRNRWRKATLIGLHSQSGHSRTLAGVSGPETNPSPAEVRLVYTRTVPDGHPRPASHLAADDLRPPAGWPEALATRAYVCGPSGFVDHATGLLRDAGYSDDRIRTERFGPSGGNQ